MTTPTPPVIGETPNKPTAITPVYVAELLTYVDGGDYTSEPNRLSFVKDGKRNTVAGNVYCHLDFLEILPTIAREYLKLHEENARLRTALERVGFLGSQQIENIAREALKEHKE